MLTRSDVINEILCLFESPRYLEIGVNQGATFHAVKATRKVAVDPKFVFSQPPVSTADCSYHEISSDTYFGKIAQRDDIFEVIFLDGLHTFEQTLRDLITALSHLAPSGVIVIDDVVPNSYHASLPSSLEARAVREHLKISDPSWMGDVYKLVFFVQTFFQTFSYATIQESHGQMVMWRNARDRVSERSIATFHDIDFAYTILHRDAFQLSAWSDIMRDVQRTIEDWRDVHSVVSVKHSSSEIPAVTAE